MTENRTWSGVELAVYPYLDCGALGHSWDYVDSNHWTPSWGEPFTVRCMRCDTERRDSLHRGDQRLLSRRYIQPPGYRFNKGERPKRIEFLLMSIDETRRKRVTRKRTIASTKAVSDR